jgi:hypothetical protein
LISSHNFFNNQGAVWNTIQGGCHIGAEHQDPAAVAGRGNGEIFHPIGADCSLAGSTAVTIPIAANTLSKFFISLLESSSQHMRSQPLMATRLISTDQGNALGLGKLLFDLLLWLVP